VTDSLSALNVRALLVDIEGTTTSIDFVYRVLFPYAREHAADFLKAHGETGAVREALTQLQQELSDDRVRGEEPPALVLDYVFWLMDRDRKSPGLKALQGLIWREGYRAGELRGEVYPDVRVAFERWRDAGRHIYIYSSGSVLAQKLLFESTAAGDLTRLINGYFDTGVGPKTAAESYAAVASDIDIPPRDILFLSDAVKELDAARAAGLQTRLCIRDGSAAAGSHEIVRSFDEIVAGA
jgi:enolase-phosphatase E1